MLDFNHFNNTNELVGKLSSQSWKVAQEKEGGLFDMDGRAFASVYHDSLDVRNHGGKVYLPEILHEKVGLKYRELVTGRRVSDPLRDSADDNTGESLPTQLENSFQDSLQVADPNSQRVLNVLRNLLMHQVLVEYMYKIVWRLLNLNAVFIISKWLLQLNYFFRF